MDGFSEGLRDYGQTVAGGVYDTVGTILDALLLGPEGMQRKIALREAAKDRSVFAGGYLDQPTLPGGIATEGASPVPTRFQIKQPRGPIGAWAEDVGIMDPKYREPTLEEQFNAAQGARKRIGEQREDVEFKVQQEDVPVRRTGTAIDYARDLGRVPSTLAGLLPPDTLASVDAYGAQSVADKRRLQEMAEEDQRLQRGNYARMQAQFADEQRRLQYSLETGPIDQALKLAQGILNDESADPAARELAQDTFASGMRQKGEIARRLFPDASIDMGILDTLLGGMGTGRGESVGAPPPPLRQPPFETAVQATARGVTSGLRYVADPRSTGPYGAAAEWLYGLMQRGGGALRRGYREGAYPDPDPTRRGAGASW